MSQVTLETQLLDALIKTEPAFVANEIKSIAFEVEGRAKVNAPFQFGALRNSINTQKKKQFTYIVQDGVEYGIHQEFGTRFMAGTPFMIPAAEKAFQGLPDRFRKMFARILR